MSLFKYEWEKKADVPYDAKYSKIIKIGTDIYVMGGMTNPYNQNYKYNTLTNTWSGPLAVVPYSFQMGIMSSIGTDIYVMGGAGASPYNQNYKYNTLTNTWSAALAVVPYAIREGGISVVVGTDIYVMGGNLSPYNQNYKYNTLTNTWSAALAVVPYPFSYGTAVYINKFIYIMGGGSTPSNKNYKFIIFQANYLIKSTNNEIYTIKNNYHKISNPTLNDIDGLGIQDINDVFKSISVKDYKVIKNDVDKSIVPIDLTDDISSIEFVEEDDGLTFLRTNLTTPYRIIDKLPDKFNIIVCDKNS